MEVTCGGCVVEKKKQQQKVDSDSDLEQSENAEDVEEEENQQEDEIPSEDATESLCKENSKLFIKVKNKRFNQRVLV